ncbi:hypothetical protein C8J57DRAFT_1472716 [Mycena rebaudengoi]|nr:hypothetical protein C8J57DRAFT_1472716 [Mycena rebaudengoi]
MNRKEKVIRGRNSKETRREAYSAHGLGVRGCNEGEKRGMEELRKRRINGKEREKQLATLENEEERQRKNEETASAGPDALPCSWWPRGMPAGMMTAGRGAGSVWPVGRRCMHWQGVAGRGVVVRGRGIGEKAAPGAVKSGARAAGDDEGRVLLPGGRELGGQRGDPAPKVDQHVLWALVLPPRAQRRPRRG